jgi:hypothetical protein
MKRSTLVATAIALSALLVPTAALGKGASEATITGTGLGNGIRLAGEGAPDGGTLMQLAEASGFFPSVFATTPSPMLSKRPHGSLGPRFQIAYVMPGPNGETSTIRQDLYPYALPNPVSYVKPGQRYFGDQATVGGWFVGQRALKDKLVAVGLPETPPSGGGFDFPWTIVAALAGIVAAAAVTVLTALRVRRRPGPATA